VFEGTLWFCFELILKFHFELYSTLTRTHQQFSLFSFFHHHYHRRCRHRHFISCLRAKKKKTIPFL
jgi:hypothetical protein